MTVRSPRNRGYGWPPKGDDGCTSGVKHRRRSAEITGMQDSGARRGEDRGRDRGVPALPALGAGVHQGQRRAERSAAGVGGVGRPTRRLGALAGVRIDAKQIERTTEALKREIAAAERIVTEPVPSPRRRCIRGLNGTGVPVRPSEIDPVARPGPARSSWPPCGPPNRATATASPCATPGSVSYNAAVESAASRHADPQPSRSRSVAAQSRRRAPAGRPRRSRQHHHRPAMLPRSADHLRTLGAASRLIAKSDVTPGEGLYFSADFGTVPLTRVRTPSSPCDAPPLSEPFEDFWEQRAA